MAAVSLFRKTKMAALTSCENTLYHCFSHFIYITSLLLPSKRFLNLNLLTVFEKANQSIELYPIF